MSDAEGQDLSTIEILLQKHKTEKKSLQAEIQAIKKAVPKGDKKREKIAKQKIADLENALKETHKQELETVEKSQKTDAIDSSTTVLDNNGEEPSETRQKSKGKAKRKQEKKAMKAKELADRLAQAEIDYEKSSRFKEE
uniref:Uncharacterized protein n=1 Tax=Ciona savignyi TaxID=51511 RepID=H2Y9H9_CIOSA